MSAGAKILVIIPAYNEENTISVVIRRVRENVPDKTHAEFTLFSPPALSLRVSAIDKAANK